MPECLDFYKGKRVFLTGHTGFKGSWLALMLCRAGARVTGYALESDTQPCLHAMLDYGGSLESVTGDVRDLPALRRAFESAEPDVVFHLAAQPLVRRSYKEPVYTFQTNVMGTVNLLECARLYERLVSLLNVTTDKVYINREWPWGYREDDPLGGFDPYSGSKGCSELVTRCYGDAFLSGAGCAVSTARAGNVIGGGDFSDDRIIPDCVRAAMAGEAITVRNPYSVRPYQHVLEPLCAYLDIARRQAEDASVSGCYNVGPDDCDCVTTGELADMFVKRWGGGLKWVNAADKDAPHEAGFLKLDCSKLKSAFGWRPTWHILEAVQKTVEWTRAYMDGRDMTAFTVSQIDEFLNAREANAGH